MQTKLGKIITIEGSDGSGKKTQTKLLTARMEKGGYKTATMAFPRYDTPIGTKIWEYLNPKEGSGNVYSVNPLIAIGWYAEDRLGAKTEIISWINSGYNVIFDRWIESNMAHQTAKFHKEDRGMIAEWIRYLEIEKNGLPESDLVVYLYLPVEWNQRAMEKEGRIKDIHEKDVKYLLKVEETYLWLASKYKNWRIINCLKKTENGEERKSVEEINDEIWAVVEPMLIK